MLVSRVFRGLVKIGQELYQTVMPIVSQQVASQIRVRDLSSAKVTISPSESTSWNDARNELVTQAKEALRSELETSLAATNSESDIDGLRKDFAKREAKIESNIDSEVHTFHTALAVTYNVCILFFHAACFLIP